MTRYVSLAGTPEQNPHFSRCPLRIPDHKHNINNDGNDTEIFIQGTSNIQTEIGARYKILIKLHPN